MRWLRRGTAGCCWMPRTPPPRRRHLVAVTRELTARLPGSLPFKAHLASYAVPVAASRLDCAGGGWVITTRYCKGTPEVVSRIAMSSLRFRANFYLRLRKFCCDPIKYLSKLQKYIGMGLILESTGVLCPCPSNIHLLQDGCWPGQRYPSHRPTASLPGRKTWVGNSSSTPALPGTCATGDRSGCDPFKHPYSCSRVSPACGLPWSKEHGRNASARTPDLPGGSVQAVLQGVAPRSIAIIGPG